MDNPTSTSLSRMSAVQLYVYDLSNGLAKSLSLPLTGKQIDGIWHTSVVVFGSEVYYGQGIMKSKPASTHHGAPLQIIPLGNTSLDQDTWEEYLEGLKEHWTAEKYHLLDFNCNSFTADAVGFLTGGSIPTWISNLPSDFLSTPFGASLRPQIDAMFNPARQTPPVPSSSRTVPNVPSQYQGLAASLLGQVAAQAASPSPSPSSIPAPSSTLTSQLQIASSSSSFHSILSSSKATIAFFTNPRTCPPCRVIEPIFERLARSKTSELHSKKISAGSYAFITVDLGIGRGGEVAREYGIRATPTFLFFLGKEKVDELKGGNERELTAKLDMLFYQAFPPHPHSTLPLPSVQAMSTSPILYGTAPNYPVLLSKLQGSLEGTGLSEGERVELMSFLETKLVPLLASKVATELEFLLEEFTRWTVKTIRQAGYGASFPLIDLWRMAVLDPRVSGFCTMPSSNPTELPPPAIQLMNLLSSSSTSLPRPFLLTSLRFLANGFSTVPLSTLLLSTQIFPSSTSSKPPREILTSVIVDNLLSEDVSLKSAAAGLAFNLAGLRHRKNGVVGSEREVESEEEGDWVLEVGIALIEAIKLENQSEDTLYRLVSALALLVYLSPYHASTLGPNLEVFGARDVLESKLSWVKRREIRGLIGEVGGKLCA